MLKKKEKIFAYKCVKCLKEFKQNEVEYTCPSCKDEGILDVLYDYEKIKAEFSKEKLALNNDFSLWRYKALLPIDDNTKPFNIQVGFTPLYKSKSLELEYGLKNVYIKDDGRNPSASLKDRASAIAVMDALLNKKDTITCSSTGNAGTSLSLFASIAGLKSVIYVPDNAPKPKLSQLLIYGSTVYGVKGGYKKAFDLSMQMVNEKGFYNRNCAINPLLVEGKKTVALEMAEQLNFEIPDYVIVSAGDGCITSSIYKGFFDLKALNITNKIPKIISVQASGCDAIKKAWENNGKLQDCKPNTLADSIAVAIPRNYIKAINAVNNSGGFFETVTDKEILEAMKLCATKTGVFAEPSAAASFAAFKKLAIASKIEKDASVVITITGNGLKDTESAQKTGLDSYYEI
ncbi:MAG: threonine synthase [Pseudomonadota bacterium]